MFLMPVFTQECLQELQLLLLLPLLVEGAEAPRAAAEEAEVAEAGNEKTFLLNVSLDSSFGFVLCHGK